MAAVDALSLETADRGGGRGRWAVAALAAIALHVGAVALFRHAPEANGTVDQPPIEMDLAPPPSGAAQTSDAGADSAPSVAAQDTPQAQPDQPTETPPEELPPLDATDDAQAVEDVTPQEAAPPEEVTELKADEVQTPPDLQAAVTLPPQETVVAREETPPPTPKKPAAKPEPKKPAPTRTAEKPTDKPVAKPKPAPAQAASQAGGANGVSNDAGAARAASADYARRIASLLAAQKRYPPEARAQRLSGRAVIAFTVNRSGRVISQSIASSSGSPILDGALRQMLARASSAFPPMPAEVPGASKSFTLPISFTFQG